MNSPYFGLRLLILGFEKGVNMAIRLGGKRIREDAGANKYSKVDFEKGFGIKLGSNIGVTGTGRQVGASLFAVMLTGFLGSLGFDICYTECGRPSEKTALLYDSFAMDQRFSAKGFVDFYDLISKNERAIGISNVESLAFDENMLKTDILAGNGSKLSSGTVDWRLISPSNIQEGVTLDEKGFVRLQSIARGDYNIFDIDSSSSFDFMLKDMDVLFVVATPLPSRMIREAERIKEFKLLADHVKIVWVINHMNGGVSKREIKRVFRSDKMLFIDELGVQNLYACEYKCTYPWVDEECRKQFWGIFTKVSLR